MKKSRLLFFAFFLLIGVGLVFVVPHFVHKPITKVLETEAYSYLSGEAKEYIKDIYEESGEIILTEKNKEDNKPYLNPKFAEYLASTPEEKEQVELIPTPFILEYTDSLDKDNATLPSSYDLRNVNGKNFITPMKDQGSLNLCWSFTTAEQIESLLLVKNNTSYNSNSTIFSTRMIDYASSTNGITDYTNDFGTRALTEGGNFLTSTIVGYNGLGLASDSYMPYSTTVTTKELSTVLNYNASLYEIDSTIRVPMITSDSTSAQIESFKTTVKQLVMSYGGAYVGTQGPGYSCSIDKGNGDALIRVDDRCIEDSGHAMQIIGWDDNYSYSYCKTNAYTHTTNTSNCNGTVVSGTGAWLLRNSWGNSYSYVHLAYDSINDDVYVFTGVSPMSSRNWSNNYRKQLDSFLISYGTADTQYFAKAIDTTEKVQKVKFFSFGQSGTFRISINTNSQSYNNIKTVTVDYPGVYTVDLSDSNVLLNGQEFSVSVISSNGVYLAKKSIAVFTSNVDSTPAIKSSIDSIELASISSNYNTRLYSYTKNIPSNSNISYSLLTPKGVDVSSYISVSNTKVAKNDVNASLMIRSTIPNGKYNLRLSYQGGTEDIPVKIGPTIYYTIQYKPNGGSGTMNDQVVEEYTSPQLTSNAFTRTGYSFNKWNTNSDGSGQSYNNLATVSLIDSNLTLYAQWKANNYTVQYNSNGGSGVMSNQTFTYGTSKKLLANTFTRTDYAFIGWNTKQNGTGTSYVDQEEVLNLTATQNGVVTLYAQWQQRQEYVTVTFKPNGGTGNEYTQTVRNSEAFTLNANTFTKTGYTFSKWNTKAGGTGVSYNNQQQFSNGISTNLTLYAQWTANTYTIQFHSNGGTGTMSNQTLTYDVAAQLSANQFTKENYRFTKWNTKQNGSGTNYQDKQSVQNLTNTNNGVIHLYAQWEEKPPSIYTINHYTVDEDNMIIDKVEPNTSLEDYQSNFELGEGYTMSIDLNGKTAIYSGSVVKIYYNQELVATYTNVVRGDPSGDGIINSADLLKIVKHLKGTETLTGAKLLAADCNFDETINSADLLKIVKYLKGTGTI